MDRACIEETSKDLIIRRGTTVPATFTAAEWVAPSASSVSRLRGGITGRLRASNRQRESVVWVTPVSRESARALTASVPVIRSTIFFL